MVPISRLLEEKTYFSFRGKHLMLFCINGFSQLVALTVKKITRKENFISN